MCAGIKVCGNVGIKTANCSILTIQYKILTAVTDR